MAEYQALGVMRVAPIGEESHYWVVPRDGQYSRSVASAGTGEYFSAIPAPLADLDIVIPGALAALIDDSTERLARFDQYALAKLGIDAPTLGPMSAVLLRTESTSSSQIENLTVGAKQLAFAQLGQTSSVNANAVLGNVRAMEAALEIDGEVGRESILLMHRRLMETDPMWGGELGRFRDQLVWVGRSGASPVGAGFVAPRPELVDPAIEDLARFIARDDLPVLVQTAIAHAQFETIHPFSDGNGRTGRALVHSILRAKSLLVNTTAPISAGLLRETERYFAALTAYREGDAEPIVASFADAAWFAATSGTDLIDELTFHLDKAKEQLQGLRTDAGAWQVLPLLISHPILNAPALSKLMGIEPVAAQRALTQLGERGVVTEQTGQKRGRVWAHTGVISTLDRYAADLRRG